METQKYYTPTIEDLYVGFECEINNKNAWDKRKIENEDELHLTCVLHGNDDVRVKYLDEQDILDLGWIKKKEELYEIENKDKEAEITKYRLLFSQYELTENDYHTELVVDIKLGDIEIIVLPLGIRNIKNKSELKKIMQMLNIK